MHPLKYLLTSVAYSLLLPAASWAQDAASIVEVKPVASAQLESEKKETAQVSIHESVKLDAAHELMLMAAAIESQSYQGTLTYEFGGPLETLAFERLVSELGTKESIRHLSGEPRNFSRTLPQDYCGNAAMRLFVQGGGTPLEHLSRFYHFNAIGRNRIADRVVNVIQIQPINDDRYGFTLGVDRDTHLPLMLTITGRRGKVLERFQFVELDLARPSTGDHDATHVAQKLPFTQARCSAPPELIGWQPGWLPAGFVVASAQADEQGNTALSFTDGLASISVFVTSIDRASGAVGVVKRGATVAAMTMVTAGQKSFKVSVVGEVPPAVARRVASSVVHRP